MLPSSGRDRPPDAASAFGRPPAMAPAVAAARGGRKPAGPGPDRANGRRSGADRPRRPGRGKGRDKLVTIEPVVPVRRMLSIAIAGFSLLLAFGLVLGSQATQIGFTLVIFGAQM